MEPQGHGNVPQAEAESDDQEESQPPAQHQMQTAPEVTQISFEDHAMAANKLQIRSTSEERKQRNRQAQAAYRERRTEYIKQLEAKNSLLERILLEKGIDVQAYKDSDPDTDRDQETMQKRRRCAQDVENTVVITDGTGRSKMQTLVPSPRLQIAGAGNLPRNEKLSPPPTSPMPAANAKNPTRSQLLYLPPVSSVAAASAENPELSKPPSRPPAFRYPKLDECQDCDRPVSGDDTRQGGLCIHCSYRRRVPGAGRRPRTSVIRPSDLSFTGIQSLAYEQWRQLHPASPFLVDRPPIQVTTSKYWYVTVHELAKEARSRGITVAASRSYLEILSMLQLDDAYNGILPRPRRGAASDLHENSKETLYRLAASAGYFREHPLKSKAPRTAAAYLEFLMSKREFSASIQAISVDEMASLRLAVALFLDSISGDPRLESAPTGTTSSTRDAVAAEVTHTTHNRGIVGSQEALVNLQQVVAQQFAPGYTSSVGFLCGPNALDNALDATRRFHYHVRMSQRLTAVRLRQLLFTNVDQYMVRNAVGDPTPEYRQYLLQRYQGLPEDVMGEEEGNMTRLNDMDIDQLVAMVVLARRQMLIEAEFSVGVVRGAFVDAEGRQSPAHARIVHEGDPGAPTLWLYNNIAAGGGEYRHFEGFDDSGSLGDDEHALSWGLYLPHTGNLEGEAGMPGGIAHESLQDRANRNVINARKRLATLNRQARQACIPCRQNERYTTCQRGVLGQESCTNCTEHAETCTWDEGTPLPGKIISAADVTTEDIREWYKPLSVIDEEDQMLAGIKQLFPPDPVPGRKHLLIIGCARKSSHPGALAMLVVWQNLIQTIHAYNVMLDNPATPNDMQRPGGPGVATQSFPLVIARHGAMPITTHTGNVHDPSLHRFIHFIDHITSPGYPVPEEIHFLLLGLAGFAVDMSRWGNRNQGFFKKILDADATHNRDLANRIYIVAVVELHVVDPASPTSINVGLPAHGIRNNNKRVIKYKLANLIDRYHDLQNAATALNVQFVVLMQALAAIHAGQPLPPGINLPVWPAARGGPLEASRLDRMIMGMFCEMAWRVGWLDGNTAPSDAVVRLNNNQRNQAM